MVRGPEVGIVKWGRQGRDSQWGGGGPRGRDSQW